MFHLPPGPAGYWRAGLLLLLLGVTLALLHVRGRRIPSPVFLALPASLVWFGTLANLVGLQRAVTALHDAELYERPRAAAVLPEVLQHDAAGWLVAALLATALAWVCAVGTLAGTSADRWKPWLALGIGGLAMSVSWPIVAACYAMQEFALVAWLSVLAAPTLGLIALRQPATGESRHHAAELRMAVAGLVLFAALAPAIATGAWIQVAQQDFLVHMSSETRILVLQRGIDLAIATPTALYVAAAASTVLLGAVAAIGLLPSIRPTPRKVWVGALLSAAMVLPPVALRSLHQPPARALADEFHQHFAELPGPDLQPPVVDHAQPPTEWTSPRLLISNRNVLGDGMWWCDLRDWTADAYHTPLEFPEDNPTCDRKGKAHPLAPTPQGVLLVQVDRRVPWRVFEPLHSRVRSGGFTATELVVLTEQGPGVILLPDPLPAPTDPDTTLDELVQRWLDASGPPG